MELAKKGKLTKEVLHEAGDCIRLEIGWNDPIDSMSVHAYITHCQNHEAIVKEKRRCENGDEGLKKRSTRSGGKNDATPLRAPPAEEAPSPKVTMGESTTRKKKEIAKGKQKGPAYKLQSNIELATNLKKVLEERILDSKVEFALGNVLGIANRRFHKEIIDIIKRKRQTLREAIRPQAEEGLSKTQGMQLQAKESNVASVGCYQSSGKVRQVQFAEDDEEYQGIPRSHYTRTRWARATTETLVKIGDLEEPIVALIDHGSEINIMSKNLYNKCKWPMDTEHGWMVKVANNSSEDISTPQGNITLRIVDAQEWMNRVRIDLEDKVETFTQAPFNEALASHLGDMDNKSDDEENEEDDDDKEVEDREEPAGTSRHHGHDDDNDDTNLLGTRPSFGGTSQESPPPPASQPEPPMSTGTDFEKTHEIGTVGGSQDHTTTVVMTYKKCSTIMVLSTGKEMAISTAMVSFAKGKEMVINTVNDSLTTKNPWSFKEFKLAKELHL
ncbi:hypothetical protein L7F22_057402 [Adiantum nelumboides]|nr:hypothetical protein [Adiantum nelumboides]